MYYILILVVVLLLLNYNYKEGMTETETIINVLNNNGLNENNVNIENIVRDLENRQICSPETINIGGIGDLDLPTNIGLNKEQLKELSMKDYKLKIESGINFHKKLTALEKKVFMLYYEDNWESEYEKMLKKRKKFISDNNSESCKSELSKYIDEYLINNPGKNINNLLNDNSDKTILNAIYILSYLEEIEEYNKNNKEFKSSELNEREVFYRNKEEFKLEQINSWMNYIYIILYVSLILILFNKNKINLFQNYYIYILLLLMPNFIYPFVFNIIKILVRKTKLFLNEQLPKNAFMD